MKNCKITPLLLFSFVCFVFSPVTCLNNGTDLDALLAIKAAMDGNQLGALTSWKKTVHFCNWTGISCAKNHPSRVVAINLSSQRLAGSLSPHIGNLSFLRRLDLQNNSFHGPIPQELGLLRRLEYVEFSNNSFTGEIPKNISGCPNLYYLNLIDNSLTGSIPHELGMLVKLQILGLTKNNLFGTIPPSIGNLTSLKLLSLRDCNLEGSIPGSLVQIRGLERFQVTGNRLTGKIPSGLFNISTIYSFVAASNQLEGTIPQDIGLKLPNLITFFVGQNQLNGTLPMSLSNATFLEEVDFARNDFTGSMPRNLERLSSMRIFTVWSNRIQADIGTVISSFTNWTSLQELDLSENPFTGSLPGSITNLSTQLWALSIATNQMPGKVPPGIENLISLTHLDLSLNDLSGPIPWTIGKVTNLQELYIDGNRFTNELPSSLGNLTFVNEITLDRNSFSGSIPRSLNNCRNLETLSFSHNFFSGSIPREIMSLSSMSSSFNLAYNFLSGPIPLEVEALTNLVDLDLSNNRLSGNMPDSLRRCGSLQRLHLERNFLDGVIPEALSDLKGLQDLDLSRNNLTGPIPSFLGELDLKSLNLSFNRLQGEVPIDGIFRNKSAVSLIGNDNLCGGIADLNFPPCPIRSSNNKHFHFSNALKIMIPLLAVAVICAILSIIFCVWNSKRRMSRKNISSMPSFPEFMKLSYSELIKITGGFSEDHVIGRGRYGSVYKGILSDDQTLVAVKVLNLHLKGASKSFIAECNALREIRHRNLLKILSVCSSTDFQGNDFKALVYEFKTNGSLDKWIHQEKDGQDEPVMTLTMVQRINIAIDIASAVEYLHSGTHSIIVHGDLKPSNILLDDDMTAYVGDFGLTKIISTLSSELSKHQSSSSVEIKGTIGYIAPEYGTNDLVSTQGDVYSFGIMLLEIFTGRRPTDDALKDHANIQDFVRASLPDLVMEIVDSRILQIEHGDKDGKIKDFLISILRIGLRCAKEQPRDRMEMEGVVSELCKIREAYLSSRIHVKDS